MLILAAPHISRLDGLALSAWLFRQGMRRVLFAVDPDYARHPLWRPLLAVYGRLHGEHRMVALDTRRPHGLRQLLRAHRDGWHLAIFPQGIGIDDPDRPEQPGALWLIRRISQEYASDPDYGPRIGRVRVRHDGWWPTCEWQGQKLEKIWKAKAEGSTRHA